VNRDLKPGNIVQVDAGAGMLGGCIGVVVEPAGELVRLPMYEDQRAVAFVHPIPDVNDVERWAVRSIVVVIPVSVLHLAGSAKWAPDGGALVWESGTGRADAPKDRRVSAVSPLVPDGSKVRIPPEVAAGLVADLRANAAGATVADVAAGGLAIAYAGASLATVATATVHPAHCQPTVPTPDRPDGGCICGAWVRALTVDELVAAALAKTATERTSREAEAELLRRRHPTPEPEVVAALEPVRPPFDRDAFVQTWAYELGEALWNGLDREGAAAKFIARVVDALEEER
jgi:hypothetical protein